MDGEIFGGRGRLLAADDLGECSFIDSKVYGFVVAAAGQDYTMQQTFVSIKVTIIQSLYSSYNPCTTLLWSGKSRIVEIYLHKHAKITEKCIRLIGRYFAAILLG